MPAVMGAAQVSLQVHRFHQVSSSHMPMNMFVNVSSFLIHSSIYSKKARLQLCRIVSNAREEVCFSKANKIFQVSHLIMYDILFSQYRT